MELNIPMNTKGAMGTDSLASLMGNTGGIPANGAVAQPQPNTAYTQPNMGMQQQNIGGTGVPPMQAGMGGMPNTGYAPQPAMPNGGYAQPNMGAVPQPNMGAVPQPNMGAVPQPNMGAVPQPNMGAVPQPRQRPQGGGVILKKGQKVPLAANGQTLTSIEVGLGWDVVNVACDLDASAFMLGANEKVIGDDWFVFYGQTASPDNSVVHSGDSQGEGVGDDETITINLAAVNPNVKKIVFVVTINEALTQGLNFSMVQNAYVRVVNKATGAELVRFNLTDYYANVTSMVVGEIYNHNGQWKFNAVGDGVAKDLEGLCGMYGVNVAG